MMEFKPLSSGDNRPRLWDFQLDAVKGDGRNTNAATIYATANIVYDPSGMFGDEEFCSITLTRAELVEIVRVLDEDIEKMREYCPNSTFI